MSAGDTRLRIELEGIPSGVYEGANRYDTDTEHVLSLWDLEGTSGETVDIRVPKAPMHQPGDRHVYRVLCEVCEIQGQLHITLVPERDVPPPPLTFGDQIADESPLGRRIAKGEPTDG